MALYRIRLRGGTAAEWTTVNPILAEREPGIETDTDKLKFGDGVTAWTGLPYVAGGSGGGGTTGALLAANNLSDLASVTTARGNLGAAPASGIAPSAITGTAVVTADSRLSNSRTPSAHAASHAVGGSDALAGLVLVLATDSTPVPTGTPAGTLIARPAS